MEEPEDKYIEARANLAIAQEATAFRQGVISGLEMAAPLITDQFKEVFEESLKRQKKRLAEEQRKFDRAYEVMGKVLMEPFHEEPKA
jgi:hypothetical protein